MKKVGKPSDYGLPPTMSTDKTVVLMTNKELLMILDILRQMTTDVDIWKQIQDIEQKYK